MTGRVRRGGSARACDPSGAGSSALGPGGAVTLALALSLVPLVPVPALAQVEGPAMKEPADAEPAWYLEVAGGVCDLFVQEYGRGRDTVVVLHGGWGAEHQYLLEPFAPFGDRYHLVFYDQRGSLRSPCPDSLVSVEGHVSDLERLRRELGLERMHLAGHSMGTYLSMFYLREHPEHTGGLVQIASNLPRPVRGEKERLLLEEHQAAKDTVMERQACARELREEGLTRPDSLLSDEERSARWRVRFACANIYRVDRWRRLSGGRAFYDGSAARAAAASMPEDIDFEDELSAHPCPVRIVEGGQNFGPVWDDLLRRQARGIPGLEVRVVERAGHNVWHDAPAEFRRVLGAALDTAAACG